MGNKPVDAQRFTYKNISKNEYADKVKATLLQKKRFKVLKQALKLGIYGIIVDRRTTWETLEEEVNTIENLVAATKLD